MQPMPPSRRNLFAWIAAASGAGTGWLRSLMSTYHDGPVSDHFDGSEASAPIAIPSV
jgi:hypothetical protein